MVAGARWAPRAFEISPQVFERSPPIASEIGRFGRDAAMRQRSRHQRFDNRRQVGWLPIHTRTLFRTFQKSWKSAERERCLTKDGATTRCQNWRFGHLYKNSFSLSPFQNDGCKEIIHNCQKYDPGGSFFQKKVHSPSVLSCAKCFHSSDYFLWWKSFRAQLIFVIEVGILFWCFRAQLINLFLFKLVYNSPQATWNVCPENAKGISLRFWEIHCWLQKSLIPDTPTQQQKTNFKPQNNKYEVGILFSMRNHQFSKKDGSDRCIWINLCIFWHNREVMPSCERLTMQWSLHDEEDSFHSFKSIVKFGRMWDARRNCYWMRAKACL